MSIGVVVDRDSSHRANHFGKMSLLFPARTAGKECLLRVTTSGSGRGASRMKEEGRMQETGSTVPGTGTAFRYQWNDG